MASPRRRWRSTVSHSVKAVSSRSKPCSRIPAVQRGRAGPRGRGRLGQTSLECMDVDLDGFEIEGDRCRRSPAPGCPHRPALGGVSPRCGRDSDVPGPSACRRPTGGPRAPPGRLPRAVRARGTRARPGPWAGRRGDFRRTGAPRHSRGASDVAVSWSLAPSSFSRRARSRTHSRACPAEWTREPLPFARTPIRATSPLSGTLNWRQV